MKKTNIMLISIIVLAVAVAALTAMLILQKDTTAPTSDDVQTSDTDTTIPKDSFIPVSINTAEWTNLGDTDISDRIDETIDELIQEYVDENNELENGSKNLLNARKKVYGLAISLKEKNIIKGCAYHETGNTVSFFLNDDTTYVYFPLIKDSYAGAIGDYTVASIDSLPLLDDKVISSLSGAGAEYAAKEISDKVEEYTNWVNGENGNVDIPYLKEFLGSLSENNVRAIFWRGHGNVYTDSNGQEHYAFVTCDKRSDEKDYKYYADHAYGRITKAGKYYAVNEKFFEEYMDTVDGGLFYTGSCYSASSRLLPAVFQKKGFDAFCGASGAIFTLHSDKMMASVAKFLTEKDSNGLYITITEAFEKAKAENGCGESYTDMILGSSLNGVEFRIVEHNHVYTNIWQTDKNCHWYACSFCGMKEYLEEHEYSDVWSIDGTSHWKVCIDCGYEGHKDNHSTPNENCSGCGYSIGLSIRRYGESFQVAGIGNCISSDIIIPILYQNMSVTTICSEAFRNCTSIKSITLHDGIDAINANAFSGCSGLASIVLPDSLSSLGKSMFSGCTALVSVVLPKEITSIPSGLFYSCESLQSISIPNTVTYIGDDAFRYCFSLENIVLPNSVTKLGARAFSDCTGLKTITLSNQLEYIDWYAFWNCSSLTSISLPESLNSTGHGVFTDCKNLEYMYCYNDNITFGPFPTDGCDKLKMVGRPGSNAQNYAKTWGKDFIAM